MDIAVRRVNSVDINYDMTLKYQTYTVVTGYRFFQKIFSADINLVSKWKNCEEFLTITDVTDTVLNNFINERVTLNSIYFKFLKSSYARI